MSVYIVLVGSEEKHGVMEPTILDFPDDQTRQAWLDTGGQHALERWQRGEGEAWGGWPTFYIIGPDRETDPDGWLAECLAIEDEDDEE